MKKLFIILFLILNLAGFSQIVDSVRYDFSFQFKDGIYLNFWQLKNNEPVEFQQLIDNSDIDNLTEYFDTVKFFSFYDEFGILKKTEKAQIFGYCMNGKPYIYFSDKFNMLPSIATISFFVTTVMVTRYYGGALNPYYSGFYDVYPPNAYRKEPELRQFLLDFNSGIVYEYTTKSVEILIKRDNDLLKTYQSLSGKKKEKQKYDFIRMFNEKYPLYILGDL